MRPSELISENAIAERVAALGAALSAEYRDAARPPLLVCVLKGGFVFLADLVRAIDVEVEVDFIGVSSYGAATSSSGEVRVTKDLEHAMEGRDVVIVEDIVDTGLTLAFLVDSFRRRGARSVRVVALLDKRGRRRVDVPVDFVGFEIGNRFVVGYGLDADERYRHLPYVGVLEEDHG